MFLEQLIIKIKGLKWKIAKMYLWRRSLSMWPSILVRLSNWGGSIMISSTFDRTYPYSFMIIAYKKHLWKDMNQKFRYLPTLTCLINGHARLFFSEKLETLPALISPCPFINFTDFVQPARLLGLPNLHFVPFSLASFIDAMTKFYPII